jgi:hypothetical protein
MSNNNSLVEISKTEKQFYELVTKAYLPTLSNLNPIPHIRDNYDSERPSRANWKRFRWIKIEQIIYNKDEVFTDKFSIITLL